MNRFGTPLSVEPCRPSLFMSTHTWLPIPMSLMRKVTEVVVLWQL